MEPDDKITAPEEKNDAGALAGQEVVLDLNFVPNWARKPPEQINYYVTPGRRDRLWQV